MKKHQTKIRLIRNRLRKKKMNPRPRTKLETRLLMSLLQVICRKKIPVGKLSTPVIFDRYRLYYYFYFFKF